MKTLEGKVAWITGAGTGIGEASARALAQCGAHVVLSGRRREELERVSSAIFAEGHSAEAAPLDVMDAEATMAIAEKLEAQLGGVDIFVANAGMNVPNRAIKDITVRDFDTVVGINLNGVMYGVLSVLPHMRKKGRGTLILVSSWAGRYPSGFTGTAYNAAKHAVLALGQTLNMEVGMDNIRCSVIMPGGVATPIMQARPDPPSPERLADMMVPKDVGALVRFIAEAPPNVCLNEVVIAPTRNRVIAV